MTQRVVRKKRCSRCREWFPASDKFFYRKLDRRTKDGTPRFDSWCKRCRAEWHSNAGRYINESETARLKRKARLRARQRAWVRLAQENPKRMEELFLEMLHEEGWDGDEDLRKGANRRGRPGKYARVRCQRTKSCGWTGTRLVAAKQLTAPCPWCGGRVNRV